MEKVDAVLRKHDAHALRVGEEFLKRFDEARKKPTPAEERARRSLVEYLERLRAAVGEEFITPGE